MSEERIPVWLGRRVAPPWAGGDGGDELAPDRMLRNSNEPHVLRSDIERVVDERLDERFEDLRLASSTNFRSLLRALDKVDWENFLDQVEVVQASDEDPDPDLIPAGPVRELVRLLPRVMRGDQNCEHCRVVYAKVYEEVESLLRPQSEGEQKGGDSSSTIGGRSDRPRPDGAGPDDLVAAAMRVTNRVLVLSLTQDPRGHEEYKVLREAVYFLRDTLEVRK